MKNLGGAFIFLLTLTLGLSSSFAELGDNIPRPRPRPALPTDGNNSAPEPSSVSLSILAYDTEDQAPRSCERFIKPDGSFGEYGERMVEAMRSVGADCFLEKTDFSYLCPKFDTFRPERKYQFLVFMFASLAAFESSCNPSARARFEPGRNNDIPDGLFQLEYSGAQRRAAGRSPEFCAPGQPIDTQGIDFQMECTASIFAKSYCGTGHAPGDTRNGYWEKLKRPKGGGEREVTQLVKRFPYCY